MNPILALILTTGMSGVFSATANAQIQIQGKPEVPSGNSDRINEQAPQIAQSEQTPATPQAAPQIRLIPKEMFCKNLQLTFVQYAATNGYSKVQTKMLASTATQMVVQEFRNGRASDYMNTAALAHYADQPDLAPKNSYLQMAKFIGTAMGLSPKVSLALGTGELRFIPFAETDMDIVVIAQNAAPLTPERAQKIVEVATAKKVRVSVLWVGPESIDASDLDQTRMLGWIVGMTGGFLTNLGGSDTICGTLM